MRGSSSAAKSDPTKSQRLMFELKILPSVREVSREAWDALVGENDSPFVEWTWLDCLEQAKCVGPGTGWASCHLTLYQDDKLVAVARAFSKGNSEVNFAFNGSWPSSPHASAF